MTRDDIIRMAREAGSIDSEDVIETVYAAFSAAAELRRLHEANAELLAALDEIAINTHDDTAERAARAAPEMLRALRNLLPTWIGDIERRTPGLAQQIRDAIAKAEVTNERP